MIDFASLLQLSILASVMYLLLSFVRTARGGGLLRGILFSLFILLAGLWWLSDLLELEELSVIIRTLAGYVVVVLAVIFQPELRRGLSQMGVAQLARRLFEPQKPETIAVVAKAMLSMSKRRVGALVAFERDTPLDDYIQSGVQVDAAVNRLLLESIFHPGGELHDGAVIVRRDRVAAALCLFPLTENIEIAKSTGTRHRAALGLTDECDAVTAAVSEETGDLSICQNGAMQRPVSARDFEHLLRESLAPVVENEEDAPARSSTWLRALHWLVTKDLTRKFAAITLALAAYFLAHRAVTEELSLTMNLRVSSPQSPILAGAGTVVMELPGDDFALLSPPLDQPIEITVSGRRGELPSLQAALQGQLTLSEATPSEGLEFPLDQISWTRIDGRSTRNLRFSMTQVAGEDPARLAVGQTGEKTYVLNDSHLQVRIEGLDSAYEAIPDRIRFDPPSITVRGPLEHTQTLGSEGLPLSLEPLVVEPDDERNIVRRLRLAPELLEQGFRMTHGQFVTVSLPVEAAPRELGVIEREIAVLNSRPRGSLELDGQAPVDPLTLWELPSHAQMASFRIVTVGLLSAEPGQEGSKERLQISAAVRDYVEQNLLVFVDVAELEGNEESRSVHVLTSWRRPWRDALGDLELPEGARLEAKRESSSLVLLTRRKGSESDSENAGENENSNQ